MSVKNISAYKFVKLKELNFLQKKLLNLCAAESLKGTLLLSEEGINLNLAGSKTAIDAFVKELTADTRFADLRFKYSFSSFMPFERLCVRIKPEIVTMRARDLRVDPTQADYIDPQVLKTWLDENRDFTLLDTRNDYEIALGTFDKAVHLNITEFNEFPDAIANSTLPRDKPLVMFCTGGVRCEKASLAAQQAGFESVYQLHHGVLNYFEECGNAHYHGDCFVFDNRTAVKPDLTEVYHQNAL